MNAYDVLFDHHNTLRGLCKTITARPPALEKRRKPLTSCWWSWTSTCASRTNCSIPQCKRRASWWPIAHAEHRQVFDQLAVVLRTPPEAPGSQDEWESFVMVLDTHAAEEERDLCP